LSPNIPLFLFDLTTGSEILLCTGLDIARTLNLDSPIYFNKVSLSTDHTLILFVIDIVPIFSFSFVGKHFIYDRILNITIPLTSYGERYDYRVESGNLYLFSTFNFSEDVVNMSVLGALWCPVEDGDDYRIAYILINHVYIAHLYRYQNDPDHDDSLAVLDVYCPSCLLEERENDGEEDEQQIKTKNIKTKSKTKKKNKESNPSPCRNAIKIIYFDEIFAF
jgi:hypothetical protein